MCPGVGNLSSSRPRLSPHSHHRSRGRTARESKLAILEEKKKKKKWATLLRTVNKLFLLCPTKWKSVSNFQNSTKNYFINLVSTRWLNRNYGVFKQAFAYFLCLEDKLNNKEFREFFNQVMAGSIQTVQPGWAPEFEALTNNLFSQTLNLWKKKQY